MSQKTNSEKSIKPTHGLVGFLDILGYQNFIDNNSVDKAVRILSKVFTGLKEAVVEDYYNSWIKQPKDRGKRFEDLTIQTLSDSIILYFPVEGQKLLVRDWLTLFQTTRVLQRRLFDSGFPSRGAIASGKYYFRDGFLVGRPFMDAYRLCQSLEFVGTALTPAAFQHFKDDLGDKELGWRHFPGGVEFLAPLKAEKEERLYCLCPLRRNETGAELGYKIPMMVRSSFWRHNKDVPAGVDRKMDNTIKFWSYWICRRKDCG